MTPFGNSWMSCKREDPDSSGLMEENLLCENTLFTCVHVCVWCVFWFFPTLQDCRLWKVQVLVTQSYLTLWEPWTIGQPGSSVQGILQARILEWVAIPISRGSFRPRE